MGNSIRALSAREKYERTPIGAMGVFAPNGTGKGELESLQPEFEFLKRLAAGGRIEIIECLPERQGTDFTAFISFWRLA